MIYVVYSALQDLNNQSQMFRKPSIEKIKRGGLGSSGKGRVSLLPSLVSSHLLLLILLLLLLFFCFFSGRGGGGVGGELALCFEFARTPLSECLEEETKC